ncbi:hypothetical protein OXX69_013816, partial [Metschnikowia pulcherrima]|jgi:hypothetical protein
MKVT